MSGPTEILNSFARHWWAYIFEITCEGAVVTLLAIIALGLARKAVAPLRYWLLVLALLKLAIPFPSAPWGMFSLASGLTRKVAISPMPQTPNRSSPPPRAGFQSPDFFAPPISPGESAVPSMAVVSPRPSRADWRKIAMTIHAVGFALMLLLIARSAVRNRSLLKRGKRVESGTAAETLQAICREVGLGHVPLLIVTNRAAVPFTGGLWRPYIVLPVWTEGMSEEELRTLLGHEVAHIIRRDGFVVWLQAVVQAWLWWNPLAWWINRRIRTERESCCDDIVLLHGFSAASAYSRLLMKVAERTTSGFSPLEVTGMAETFHTTQQRLRRIMAPQLRRSAKVSFSAAVVLVILALFFMPGGWGEKVEETPKSSSRPPLKQLEVALRSYCIDWERYPIRLTQLTTPVAYIAPPLWTELSAAGKPPYDYSVDSSGTTCRVFGVAEGSGFSIDWPEGLPRRAARPPLPPSDPDRQSLEGLRAIVNALWIYHLDHHRYPERLDQLTTPTNYIRLYPGTLPRDPFASGTQPYGYWTDTSGSVCRVFSAREGIGFTMDPSYKGTRLPLSQQIDDKYWKDLSRMWLRTCLEQVRDHGARLVPSEAEAQRRIEAGQFAHGTSISFDETTLSAYVNRELFWDPVRNKPPILRRDIFFAPEVAARKIHVAQLSFDKSHGDLKDLLDTLDLKSRLFAVKTEVLWVAPEGTSNPIAKSLNRMPFAYFCYSLGTALETDIVPDPVLEKRFDDIGAHTEVFVFIQQLKASTKNGLDPAAKQKALSEAAQKWGVRFSPRMGEINCIFIYDPKTMNEQQVSEACDGLADQVRERNAYLRNFK